VGLRNVRERLALHFGERARLYAGFVGRGRWLSEIRMPLLQEPAAAERQPAAVHA